MSDEYYELVAPAIDSGDREIESLVINCTNGQSLIFSDREKDVESRGQLLFNEYQVERLDE